MSQHKVTETQIHLKGIKELIIRVTLVKNRESVTKNFTEMENFGLSEEFIKWTQNSKSENFEEQIKYYKNWFLMNEKLEKWKCDHLLDPEYGSEEYVLIKNEFDEMFEDPKAYLITLTLKPENKNKINELLKIVQRIKTSKVFKWKFFEYNQELTKANVPHVHLYGETKCYVRESYLNSRYGKLGHIDCRKLDKPEKGYLYVIKEKSENSKDELLENYTTHSVM